MGNDLNLRRITADSFYNLARQMLVTTFQLVTSVLLARGLGVEGKGVFAVTMLLPSMLKSFLNLGGGPAIAYHVAHRDHDIGTALRGALSLGIWAGLLGMFLGTALVLFGDTLFPGVGWRLLVLALIVFPIDLLYNYLRSILLGLQDFKAYNLVLVLPRFLNIFLVALFIFW